MGHRVFGTSLLHLGELGPARMHLEQALALHDPVHHCSLAFRYAHFDPRAAGLVWLSWTLLMLGYPEQARLRSRDALTCARELSHVTTAAHALSRVANLYQFYRDHDAVRDRTDELISLAAEQALPEWLATGTILQGWALAVGGGAGAGGEQLRQGLATYQTIGARLWVPYFLALLAEVQGRAGQAAEALALLHDALARVATTGERWFEAELHRLKGELLLALSPEHAAEAEACLRRALVVARDQAARLWELRAAASLAQLCRDQGRRSEAHDLLAPIYGWFTEGFDTADLKDAKALLDELA
jgi:predicted ATPase